MPQFTYLRDGRGDWIQSTIFIGLHARPHGPHWRREYRKEVARVRGFDAWAHRCPHHDPICSQTHRVYTRKWWDGVRAAQGCSIYAKPAQDCECECEECLTATEEPRP